MRRFASTNNFIDRNNFCLTSVSAGNSIFKFQATVAAQAAIAVLTYSYRIDWFVVKTLHLILQMNRQIMHAFRGFHYGFAYGRVGVDDAA